MHTLLSLSVTLPLCFSSIVQYHASHPPIFFLIIHLFSSVFPMRLPFYLSRHSSLCLSHFQSPLFFLAASPLKTVTLPAFYCNWPRMNYTTNTTTCYDYNHRHCRRREQKVLVIMGATGTGKSRLSVDLATRFFPSSEIINSDKMQVYGGLDITTNKISIDERRGVPHHLLGRFDPREGEISPTHFRSLGASVVAEIASRGNLPIIVGGSNSFIHSLLVDSYHPDTDPFDELSPSLSSELRYNCCFSWVDVSFPVLVDYLSKRVDEMLDFGMVEELAESFDAEAEDIDEESDNRVGLRKAIGVSEFDRYFNKYPPPEGVREGIKCRGKEAVEDRLRRSAREEAVRRIKENTWRLAKRQMRKIERLRAGGWDLHRVDATEAFRAARVTSGTESTSCAGEIWEREVLEPSVKLVKRFLRE